MTGRFDPVANVVEFRDRFDLAVRQYQDKIRPRLEAWRRSVDPTPGNQPVVDAELEAHIRNYIVDPLLAALNWTADENLTIEALVRSQESDTRRRLDYLGIETDTMRPLLVVEAKRPNSPLPQPTKAGEGGASYRREDILATALTVLKKNNSAGTNLIKSWDGWLKTLVDYIRSLHATPIRVVMTDGNWLIVFEDPVNAFIDAGAVSASGISIYENRDTIRHAASVVFESLNYNRMVPFGRPLEAAQIPVVIGPADITHAMRAVLVTYVSTPTGLEVVPTVHMVPEMLLHRKEGGWFRVRRNEKFRLPHEAREMPNHLGDISAAHERLSNDVCAAIGRPLTFITVEESYANSWLGTCTPGVLSVSAESFLIVTGAHTHFVIAPDDHRGCPFHGSGAATAAAAGLGFTIAGPSAHHTTSFGDGTAHHCAHRTMRQLKEAQVNDTNRDRFAPRGSVEDGPFCKIWAFERFLCCQTCAFREICKQSIARSMPCRVQP
jgi:hypothetical protein